MTDEPTRLEEAENACAAFIWQFETWRDGVFAVFHYGFPVEEPRSVQQARKVVTNSKRRFRGGKPE